MRRWQSDGVGVAPATVRPENQNDCTTVPLIRAARRGRVSPNRTQRAAVGGPARSGPSRRGGQAARSRSAAQLRRAGWSPGRSRAPRCAAPRQQPVDQGVTGGVVLEQAVQVGAHDQAVGETAPSSSSTARPTARRSGPADARRPVDDGPTHVDLVGDDRRCRAAAERPVRGSIRPRTAHRPLRRWRRSSRRAAGPSPATVRLVRLAAVRVADRAAEHLVAAADPEDRHAAPRPARPDRVGQAGSRSQSRSAIVVLVPGMIARSGAPRSSARST